MQVEINWMKLPVLLNMKIEFCLPRDFLMKFRIINNDVRRQLPYSFLVHVSLESELECGRTYETKLKYAPLAVNFYYEYAKHQAACLKTFLMESDAAN